MSSAVDEEAVVYSNPQKHRRLRCAIEVEVVAGLMRERATSHDLSGGGLFVDTAQEYVPGQQLTVAFRLDGRFIRTRARIVHVRPLVGFGAEFLCLTHDQRRHIIRFVHRERAKREAEQMIEDATMRMIDDLDGSPIC